MNLPSVPISVAPEVGAGHLCLVGAGEYLDAMAPLDRELLALTPAARESREPHELHQPQFQQHHRGECAARSPRVVCLPTAAGTEGETVVRRWMEMGVAHFRALGADVEALPIVDRATACDEAMASVIRQADLVYLSGGRPPHLLDSLRGTPTWSAILAVLARGGVLAGCSAGAMILGGWIPNWPALTTRRAAFGLVPNAIVLPHFDQMFGRLAGMAQLARPRGAYLLGVDGMTGLLVGTDGWRVLGERRVVIDTGDGRVELRAEDGAASQSPPALPHG
jgi:cyanophycinase-like exopeptidase